jgi:hypothetical protein
MNEVNEEKRTFIRKFSNKKIMDLGIQNSKHNYDLFQISNSDSDEEQQTTTRRISNEKLNIFRRKIRSINRVKIHMKNQKTLQNIYEFLIQNIEKVE